MKNVVLSFADVDLEAFEKATRNERNYILLIALSMGFSISLTTLSVFYLVQLFINTAMALPSAALAGGLSYFALRTLLRESKRKKLYFFLGVAVLNGVVFSIPFKVASMKTYLANQIVESAAAENDSLYQDLVVSVEQDYTAKRQGKQAEITKFGSEKNWQGRTDAQREMDKLLKDEKMALERANKRFEESRKEPDTSALQLVGMFLNSMFSSENSAVSLFANLTLMFFFILFESLPVLARFQFKEETSIYLQAVAHKTYLANQGFQKVMQIDYEIFNYVSLSKLKIDLLEKAMWTRLSQLLSQDDPDQSQVQKLIEDIAYIEEQKKMSSSSSEGQRSWNASENGTDGSTEEAPEFDYEY